MPRIVLIGGNIARVPSGIPVGIKLWRGLRIFPLVVGNSNWVNEGVSFG